MPVVTELELYDLPIGEQSFADNPDPYMLAALEQYPWLAKSDYGIVITERQAVEDLLRRDDRLKTPAGHIVDIMGGAGTNWARFEHECLIARDGEAHARIRDAVRSAFTPGAVNTYRESIRTVVSDLLDDWVPRGAFDFEDFASRFPVAVMFGLLGIPRSRIEDVKEWLEIFGQSFSLNKALFPRINDAFDNLWNFAEGLLNERRENVKATDSAILDLLIKAEDNDVLSHNEVMDLILFLFAGGYDTSKNQLCHIMNFMVERPEMWMRCASDTAFCDDVVAETLRHSGVATSYRNVATEFEYRDIKFPVGTMLIFPLGIVCRYSDFYENPMTYLPGRKNATRHTAFSRGMHVCLGQFLARVQIAEGLHLIAKRIRNPRRNGDVVWRLFPGVWGPLSLPIAFDAAELAENPEQ